MFVSEGRGGGGSCVCSVCVWGGMAVCNNHCSLHAYGSARWEIRRTVVALVGYFMVHTQLVPIKVRICGTIIINAAWLSTSTLARGTVNICQNMKRVVYRSSEL